MNLRRAAVLLMAVLGLVATGLVASPMAEAAVTPRPVEVSPSSGSSNVKTLQHVLSAYGIRTLPDGDYGKATTKSVKTYQAKNKLTQDGAAGPVTLKKMLSGSTMAVRQGSSNSEAVKAVQQQLVKVGMKQPVTGTFGETTDANLRSFQKEKKLPVTGTADYTTWTYLLNPPASNSSGSNSSGSNQQKAYKYFVSKGYSKAQAAGIVGNLVVESNVDPKAKQGGGGPGRGIAQWTVDDRWDLLVKRAKSRGQDPLALQTQLEFVTHELDTVSYWGKADLRKATSVKTATVTFQNKYERCNPKYCHTDRRIAAAEQAYKNFA